MFEFGVFVIVMRLWGEIGIIVSLIVQEQRHGRNEEWESSGSRPSVNPQKVI